MQEKKKKSKDSFGGRPDLHVKRIRNRLKQDKALRNQLRERYSQISDIVNPNTHARWTDTRDYGTYNDDIFGHHLPFFGFGKNIEDALQKVHKKKNGGRLRILEEGAGKGIFLSELSRRMTRRGIDTEITALDMNNKEQLGYKKWIGEIDNIASRKAEFYYPKEKQDAIFSVYGPTHYTLSPLRKDHVLKLATSLNKGGIMMLAFDLDKPVYKKDIEWKYGRARYADNLVEDPADWQRKKNKSTMNIPWGLSSNPKPVRKLTSRMEMEGIENAFAKRGFKAKFFRNKPAHSLPEWVLLVQRTNEPYKKKEK